MNRLLRGVDRTSAIVAAVFIGGAIVRLAFMLGYEPAFLGIPDSGSYITSAHQGLFSDLYHPAGYPLFVRLSTGSTRTLGFFPSFSTCSASRRPRSGTRPCAGSRVDGCWA